MARRKISIRSIADIDQERKRLSDMLGRGEVSWEDIEVNLAELDDIESLLSD